MAELLTNNNQGGHNMKRSINIEIGEGLFANEPVPVEIEFADHTATFFMTALTQSVVADLEKKGVKFDTQ